MIRKQQKPVEKRVSQLDIARASGVSQSVVSSVFNEASTILVSDETRKKVLDAANSLGYRTRFVSANAWGRVQTKNILWLERKSGHQAPGQNNTAANTHRTNDRDLLAGTLSALEQHGYSLIFKLEYEEKRLKEWFSSNPVEGVIWRDDAINSALFSWIRDEYPVVVLADSQSMNIDRVAINEEENILKSIAYLNSRGHQKIAYFGHSPGSSCLRRRRRAYEDFMESCGQRIYHEFFEIPDLLDIPSPVKARDIIQKWRDLGEERPTAIILNDMHANHLVHELLRQNFNVPNDLSIIGIDNIAYDQFIEIPLTYMRQPLAEIGSASVDLLLTRLKDPKRVARQIMISAELVEGKSVKKLIASRSIAA